MASKAGCPIIPIAINNSAQIWEAHLPAMKKTHVVIEYGKPIIIKDLPKEDQKAIGAYCQKQIEEMLKKNQALV